MWSTLWTQSCKVWPKNDIKELTLHIFSWFQANFMDQDPESVNFNMSQSQGFVNIWTTQEQPTGRANQDGFGTQLSRKDGRAWCEKSANCAGWRDIKWWKSVKISRMNSQCVTVRNIKVLQLWMLEVTCTQRWNHPARQLLWLMQFWGAKWASGSAGPTNRPW